jgi:hypothetical protein
MLYAALKRRSSPFVRRFAMATADCRFPARNDNLFTNYESGWSIVNSRSDKNESVESHVSQKTRDMGHPRAWVYAAKVPLYSLGVVADLACVFATVGDEVFFAEEWAEFAGG